MRNQFMYLSCCLLVLAGAGVTRGELVGHWKLDDGAGLKIADSSGKGNEGTIVNKPTWITGVQGGALEFHGLGAAGGGGDYINCGNNASLDVRGPISITLWIRPGADEPEANGTETAPMAKADSAANPSWSWQVRYGWGGAPKTFMAFTFNTSPRAWAFVGRNLVRDEWCHIACSHDGTTLKCYLNGEQTDSTPMGLITSSPAPVLIGSDGWGCDWIGAIDDVRIYNHGLTWDEIAELCPPSRTAKEPQPADGAVGVMAPLFTWKAGYKAVLHEVYLGTTPELGAADLVRPRLPTMVYWHAAPPLQPGTTYYWRVDEIEADMTTVNTGHVWSFTTQALTAYLPVPANGSVDASVAPTLQWQPGQAAVKHHLYFGDSSDAVSQGVAAADKGELTDTSFAPGELAPLTQYFWRVDEVVGVSGELRPGAVWSFTTYLPVDDFESYNDDEGKGTRIYETWIDGYGDQSSGSTVGNWDQPFAEQTIIHGGLQSMPMDYNNVNEPFYSEATREFTPVQDWTADGVTDLTVCVRGRSGNATAPLYVVLEDASNHSAFVVCPNAAAVTSTKWIVWKMALSDFTGVNLAKVKKLAVGVGDKADPKKGGTGRIFVDDIYLTLPAQAQ